LILLLCALLPWAADSLAAAPPDNASVIREAPGESPGIEQLIPMATILAVEAGEARNLLAKVKGSGVSSTQVEDNQKVLLDLDQRLEGWGPVSKWSEGRLLGARQRLITVRDRQKTQLAQLAVTLKTCEETRLLWTDRRVFWENWQKSLPQAKIRASAGTFQQSLATIRDVIGRAEAAVAELADRQQKLMIQQDIVSAWIAEVDGALAILHGPLFEVNALPLLSNEFFSQFDASLWAGLRDDLRNALTVPANFATRQGGIALLQLVFALAIAWQLHRRARQPEPVTEQWRFLFRHPLSGGIFVSVVVGAMLYISPPPLWRWTLLIPGTISATVLICAMLERPRLRRVIITLAVLFVISMTFRLIGLVQPLYRLYLTGVCGVAIPLCLIAGRRQRLRNQGRIDLLTAAFYLGVLAGITGIFAQLAGYASLASFLVEAFLGSTFVLLFARMALHLGAGGIEALLKTELIGNRNIVRKFGPEAGTRLNTLLHVIIIAYAGLYLLVQWRVYLSPLEAWNGIRTLSFKVGELQVSVNIILMTGVVLYLTFIVSWLIQAFLDVEVMTPRNMEHGVKFAIKTLFHYSLILLGFLVAISVAGVDMSKFAVLAGALGVGIGFGLQNIVNNFISGLILLFERPVKIGDMIGLDDQLGRITRIGLRSTVVETFDRSEVIVPNAELISQRVTNWTFTSNVARIILPVGVAYGTPLERVLSALQIVARNHAEVLHDPEPIALFIGFGDSAINFELRAWIGDVNERLRIRSELGLAIDEAFRNAGIVIPFPQHDLHLQSVAPNLLNSLHPGNQGAAKTNEDPSE
jgi:small-conductance mechanosensitive channel